jgi:hypothetical protein
MKAREYGNTYDCRTAGCRGEARLRAGSLDLLDVERR